MMVDRQAMFYSMTTKKTKNNSGLKKKRGGGGWGGECKLDRLRMLESRKGGALMHQQCKKPVKDVFQKPSEYVWHKTNDSFYHLNRSIKHYMIQQASNHTRKK